MLFQLVPVISIAGDRVNQSVTQVYLIVFCVPLWDMEDYFILSGTGGQVGAHLAGVRAHARGGELDAGGYIPAFRIVCAGQCQAAANGGHTITASGGLQL